MNKETIQMLADLEVKALLFAGECRNARKQLEKVEGPTPTSRKGGLSEAEIIELSTRRKRMFLKKRLKK